MKKILLTLTVFILTINYSYAGECKIKNNASPALLEFIKDNRKVIKNISQNISYSRDGNQILAAAEDEFNRYTSILTRAKNKTFNYDGYESYFEYYVTYPVLNDLPIQIKRDYYLIQREKEYLDKYIKKLINNKNTFQESKNSCKGIDKDCNLQGTNLDVLLKISDNINNIQDLYRLSVIGKPGNFDKELFFINTNGISEIKSNYSPRGYDSCSNLKGGFFEKVKTSINEIKLLNEQADDGIKKWKDSLDLLFGKKSNSEYKKLEKELLKKEMSRQGVSKRTRENMLEALDDFNQNGLSLNNNFVKNTFNNLISDLTSDLKEFQEEIIGDFFDKKPEKDIVISDIDDFNKKSNITNNVKIRIDTLYKEQLPFSAIQNLNSNELKTRIINTHGEIVESINTLENTIKNAEKVCNQQDTGKGKCRY